MLTGKVAFPGDSVTDTLAGVIRAEPDWSQLPATTPMRVRVLLQRCLQKDLKQRLQAIGDARISLDEVIAGGPEPPAAVSTTYSAKRWPLWLAWGAAALLLVTSVSLAFVHFREKPAPAAAVQRFEVAAPDVGLPGPLSPDGTRLVFISSARLWLRRMDSLDAHPVEGTENVSGLPFWSPDSRFIVFGANRKLKIIDSDGGSPQILCDSGPVVLGGFWTPDGKIVFGNALGPQGLFEVSAAGGVSSPLRGSDSAGLFPVLLPDRQHFLAFRGNVLGGDVYLGSLGGNPGQSSSVKILTGVLPGTVYAPSPHDPDLGYLLFVRAAAPGELIGTLNAQPFDLRKLALAGEPVPIAQGVAEATFSTSSLTSTLVYGSGNAGTVNRQQLTLFDRQGKILGTVGEPGPYTFMAFSPDGKRVVSTRRDLQSGAENLWMMDLVHGINTRFTFDSVADILPVWSPDGTRVAFGSDRSGKYDLYEKLSNGGGDEELLFKSDSNTFAQSWSGDGRFLLFAEGSPPALNAFVLALDGNAHPAGKPFIFAQKGVGRGPRFSPGPQGRPLWVA